MTVLTPAVNAVAAGAVVSGGTAVVEVVLGVVVVDGVLVEVLVDVAVDDAGPVESAAAEEDDEVGMLRAVELVPLHAVMVSRGRATASAVRSQ